MSKVCSIALAAMMFVATGWAATSPVEVLYVAEPQATNVLLTTYNVNPDTAVAEQVGSPITVSAANVDPLTINEQNFIYVWDSTDVWTYNTNAQGVPESAASQHLTFGFPHPVTSFLVDPDGKFAYAGMIWVGPDLIDEAAVILFTLDSATGNLTNTGQSVIKYSNLYTGITGFVFGTSGKRLYASYFDNGPYTCNPGYYAYNVNASTGQLGPEENLVEVSADCGGTAGVTASDQATAWESACCGDGSGSLTVTQTATKRVINCQVSEISFCGDNAALLEFDPTGQNLFFGDSNNQIIYVAHLDFGDLQLEESGTAILGTPPIYFSPDGRLVYMLHSNENTVAIQTFDPATGVLSAYSTLSDSGNVSIATATLP
jgi:hypothetical protein